MSRGRRKTVTLVLGGVRSGKSHYALELAAAFHQVVFIATARRTDAEMRARIAKHRRERPAHWQTLEVPTGLDHALREQCQGSDLVLIDCLTFYLANVMGRRQYQPERVRQHMREICDALRKIPSSVVIVSNEVGSGVVPAYQSGREYRDLLGEFNQKIAQIADRVTLMVAGLPLVVKNHAGGGKAAGKKR